MALTDELHEIEPSGLVRYIVARKDGTNMHVDEGQAANYAELPSPGDGHWLNGIGTRIKSIVHTPNLPFTWHVVAEEH